MSIFFCLAHAFFLTARSTLEPTGAPHDLTTPRRFHTQFHVTFITHRDDSCGGVRIGSKECKSPILPSFTETPLKHSICAAGFEYGLCFVNCVFVKAQTRGSLSHSSSADRHDERKLTLKRCTRQDQLRSNFALQGFKNISGQPGLVTGIRSPREQVLASSRNLLSCSLTYLVSTAMRKNIGA